MDGRGRERDRHGHASEMTEVSLERASERDLVVVSTNFESGSKPGDRERAAKGDSDKVFLDITMCENNYILYFTTRQRMSAICGVRGRGGLTG